MDAVAPAPSFRWERMLRVRMDPLSLDFEIGWFVENGNRGSWFIVPLKLELYVKNGSAGAGYPGSWFSLHLSMEVLLSLDTAALLREDHILPSLSVEPGGPGPDSRRPYQAARRKKD